MNILSLAVVAVVSITAPEKALVKPDEPVVIQFLQSDKPDAAVDVAALGLKAAAIPGLFAKAAPAEIAGDTGPQFHLYTFEGKPLKPTDAKPAAPVDLSSGSIDISAYYPQVKEGGTYILTWKDSTPLVIHTLAGPNQPVIKETLTITHIEPLSYAVISTDKGDIKATFAYDVAPHTVDNFISLADEKLYDGSTFHRIIKGFMIQGGDTVSNIEGRAGTGGPGYSLADEFSDKQHVRGVLSMAHAGAPDSGGSQFFIMLDKKSFLNGHYAAFGQVIDGMDIVDKIAETKVSDDNGTVAGPKPVIKSIRILPATPEMYGIKK